MINLTSGGNTAIDAGSVKVSLSWPVVAGESLDTSAYLLTASGKVRGDHDMVFYNQKSGADGAVQLENSGAGSVTFAIDLAKVPADIERIVFCATAETSAGAGTPVKKHAGLKLTLTDGINPLADFAPDIGNASEAAMMVAELYRRNGWKIRAVGQGFNGGLAPLARSFGIQVDEPAPPPPAPPPPPPPPAAPPPAAPAPSSRPVSLAKITLDKNRPTVSLEKGAGSFGEIKINLNWNRGKKGFFGGGAIDLDLGCLVEMANGEKGAIQALGNTFGYYDGPPFVQLSGDDRTGDVAGGETMRINGAQWNELRRVAIYAYIYEGAPNWSSTDGVVTITAPGQPPIEVLMTEGRNDRGFCGVALIENDRGAIRITRLVEYYRNHKDYDERLGFGMRWSAGRKD